MVWSLLLAAALTGTADQPPAADTVVVCPPDFREALEPWVEHRTRQGRTLHMVSNLQSADEIRQEIRAVAARERLRWIVLVGDADPRAAVDPELRKRHTPTRLVPAKVNIKWGSEPQIATDNWYADLDDDLAPDVAVGRIPADSPGDLAIMIRKTLDYEARAAHGLWPRRINFVAGVGGFGRLIDPIIENTTKKFLTDGIPAGYQTTMTYGSWRSAFCPDPREFHRYAMQRHNEGCLFWVYIGHGQRTYLDRVQTPAGRFPILDIRDMPRLNCRQGAPIAIFLACYTGAFDDSRDCLAEEMLRAEGGPVAVLGGSRVTMPYAMAVLGASMMDEYFQNRRQTLGEVLLHAKQELAAKVPDDLTKQEPRRALLDGLARAISPDPELLAEERLEHLALFNLLGDPLLRLPHPQTLQVTAPDEIVAGQPLACRFSSDLPGKATLEFVCRRDKTKTRYRTRSMFDISNASLIAYNQRYEAANDQAWLRRTIEFSGGQSDVRFATPQDARGSCYVRVFIDGREGYAIGAANVYVRPRPTAAE